MGPPILDRAGAMPRVFSGGQMPRTDATYHRSDGASAVRAQLLARLLARAAVALCALLSLLLCGAGPAPDAVAAGAPSTLVIEGAGEGHGVGMSQDGALGYAEHGFTYTQILAHYYTGTTIAEAPPKTVVKVLIGTKVRRVPLERYVKGVIGNEASPSWPAAALEAQAVASRTYALTAHAGGSRFDVYSDTRSQVYRSGVAETATTNAAVAATAGQIVEYAGKPAITYFFASSGGMTESVQNGFPGSEPQPWLVAVADEYEGTASRWKIELPFATAARRLRGLYKGAFHGIEVLERGASPRILSARVLGSTAADAISGPALAARLGLSSTWAYFDVRRGSALVEEPDHSGKARTFSPAAPAPASAPAPTPAPSGGVEPAPAAAASVPTVGPTGGTEPD